MADGKDARIEKKEGEGKRIEEAKWIEEKKVQVKFDGKE